MMVKRRVAQGSGVVRYLGRWARPLDVIQKMVDKLEHGNHSVPFF
jgi:hypothetical protein